MGRRYFQTQNTVRYAILEGKSKELLIERLPNNTQKVQAKITLQHQCRSIMSRKKFILMSRITSIILLYTAHWIRTFNSLVPNNIQKVQLKLKATVGVSIILFYSYCAIRLVNF